MRCQQGKAESLAAKITPEALALLSGLVAGGSISFSRTWLSVSHRRRALWRTAESTPTRPVYQKVSCGLVDRLVRCCLLDPIAPGEDSVFVLSHLGRAVATVAAGLCARRGGVVP